MNDRIAIGFEYVEQDRFTAIDDLPHHAVWNHSFAIKANHRFGLAKTSGFDGDVRLLPGDLG